MGYQSDGVLAAFQETSWPAQLARLAHREITLPLIAEPGCGAPIIAPLALGRRLSGEPIGQPFTSRICAPNEPGVTLPTQNLAINGALTRDALFSTPEAPDPDNDRLYARVLPPGMTQVSAMMSLDPKLVSVEFGGNEVLGARLGYFMSTGPDRNVVSVSEWAPLYRQLVDSVARVTKHAVLVGLIDDIGSFPSMRRSMELWFARETFATLWVTISNDCSTNNLMFLPVVVLRAAALGREYRAQNMPPYVLHCTNYRDDQPVDDAILGPATVEAINAQLAQMNAVIREEAQKYGFAYFPLSALYDAAGKPQLDAYAIMTSATPFGDLISLDGVHPNAAGSTVLARAAAAALNDTYQMGIPLPALTLTPLLATR
jgi:hypothetical protein